MEYVTSWERKGIAMGLEQGRQQGQEKGMEKGIEKGIEQGLQQGRLEGQLAALRTVLLDLLAWRFGTIDGSVKLRVATIGSIDAEGSDAPRNRRRFAGRPGSVIR